MLTRGAWNGKAAPDSPGYRRGGSPSGTTSGSPVIAGRASALAHTGRLDQPPDRFCWEYRRDLRPDSATLRQPCVILPAEQQNGTRPACASVAHPVFLAHSIASPQCQAERVSVISLSNGVAVVLCRIGTTKRDDASPDLSGVEFSPETYRL